MTNSKHSKENIRTKLKKPLVILMILAIASTNLPTRITALDPSISNAHREAQAIETLHNFGVMKGDGQGNFMPEREITRAEFVAMADRAFGYQTLELPETTSFSDITEGAWYAGYVKTALALGYVQGYGNRIFAPDDKITRKDATTIIKRILRYLPDTPAPTNMSQDHMTRGEAAQMLLSTVGNIVDHNLDANGREYGNLTIRRAGVNLRNVIVNGDLIITEAAEDGTVHLENVVVHGRLLITGGGMDHVSLVNVRVEGNIYVDKPMIVGNSNLMINARQCGDEIEIFRGTVNDLVVAEGLVRFVYEKSSEMLVFNFTHTEKQETVETTPPTIFRPRITPSPSPTQTAETPQQYELVENPEPPSAIVPTLTPKPTPTPTATPTSPPNPPPTPAPPPTPPPTPTPPPSPTPPPIPTPSTTHEEYSITLEFDGNRGEAISSQIMATEGEVVIIEAFPEEGSVFVQWDVISGGVTLTNPQYPSATFIMPDKNVTIRAQFEDVAFDTQGELHVNTTPLTRTTLTPLSGENTAAFNVKISGFESDAEQYMIFLGMSHPGLDVNIGFAATPVGGVVNQTVTVKYTGLEAQRTEHVIPLKITSVSVYTTASTPERTEYHMEPGNVSVGSITVLDGRGTPSESDADDRRIPVRQENIKVFNDFARTANGLRRHYKLVEDIVLSGTNNWTPIGIGEDVPTHPNADESHTAFVGSFSGYNYTISGISIIRPIGTSLESSHLGLFGYIGRTGLVHGIRLNNVEMTGGYYVGAIAGINRGTVENVHVSVNISGQAEIGGIIGENRGGNLRLSSSHGSVTLADVNNAHCAGGLVGYATNDSLVEMSFSTAKVSGHQHVGGLIGQMYVPIADNNYVSILRNSYSTGMVTAPNTELVDNVFQTFMNSIGGVVGFIDRRGTVQNTFATGEVLGFRPGINNAGGIVGNVMNAQNRIEGNVALNPTVRRASGISANFGRIVGGITAPQQNTLINNRAHVNLRRETANGLIANDPEWIASISQRNTIMGQSIENPTWEFWTGTSDMNWDPMIWEWNPATKLPILRGFEPETQNHAFPPATTELVGFDMPLRIDNLITPQVATGSAISGVVTPYHTSRKKRSL